MLCTGDDCMSCEGVNLHVALRWPLLCDAVQAGGGVDRVVDFGVLDCNVQDLLVAACLRDLLVHLRRPGAGLAAPWPWTLGASWSKALRWWAWSSGATQQLARCGLDE